MKSLLSLYLTKLLIFPMEILIKVRMLIKDTIWLYVKKKYVSKTTFWKDFQIAPISSFVLTFISDIYCNTYNWISGKNWTGIFRKKQILSGFMNKYWFHTTAMNVIILCMHNSVVLPSIYNNFLWLKITKGWRATTFETTKGEVSLGKVLCGGGKLMWN